MLLGIRCFLLKNKGMPRPIRELRENHSGDPKCAFGDDFPLGAEKPYNFFFAQTFGKDSRGALTGLQLLSTERVLLTL